MRTPTRYTLGGVLFALSAAAIGQTVTTTGGKANTVPMFSGATSIVNSPLSVSGSNVGVGTATPGYVLDIQGGSSQDGLALEINSSSTFDAMRWITPTHIYQATVGGSGTGVYANSWYIYDQTNLAGRLVINANGAVGLGTFTPVAGLDVDNGIIHVGGLVSPPTPSQGAYIGWNTSNGQGETDFINNPGLGVGGWYFVSVPKAGSPETTALKISPGGALTFADGTVQATAWNGVLAGGDYAESVSVSGDKSRYEPGDIIVIDATQHGRFAKSNEPYSTLVAGIYSTKPGLLGRRQSGGPKASTTEIPMAMVGIVPTKVSTENGPIKDGDLLVTSSTAGLAMKGTDPAKMMGAVIGKAMDSLESGDGVIEVLVRLQ
jgi:hypothetical protein